MSGYFLLLALDAGLLVVFAAARLGQESFLLDRLAKALQGRLEGLVLTNDDLSQYVPLLPGRGMPKEYLDWHAEL